MSTLHRNTSQPVQPEPSLKLLLPGEQLDAALAPPAGLLEPYVSTQSLTGHVALEDVGPFNGVYNIDGLLFIELDGHTYEVEFDSDNFRFNVVSPNAPAQASDEGASEPTNREQILREWHPLYLEDCQKWMLLSVGARLNDAEQPARLMTLPQRVDALLKFDDLLTISETVKGFVQSQVSQDAHSARTHTLLLLLAAPHLPPSTLSHDNAKRAQQLSIVLEQMISSAQADTLAGQLLSALKWYGGDEGETTVPVIRQHLVWAALMLELNPPRQQRRDYIAGYDLEGPQNWGLTYPQRREQLLVALSAKTSLPELALHILTPALPDFMVQGIDEDLRHGTAPWANFIHGVSLANALDPASAPTLTFEALIRLPMTLSKAAAPEELMLIAATRVGPSLTWAIANGVLPGKARTDYSSSELATAASALDAHIANGVSAAEGLTREAPDRVQMALQKLHQLFGDRAEQIKKRIMHPVNIADRFDYSLRSDDMYSGAQFYLLDVFAAGHMKNGMDKFQPVSSHDQVLVNRAFGSIAHQLEGIDIPHMFEGSYRFYEAQSRLAYTFIVDSMWAQIPGEDRRALHYGRVKIHTLRTFTGKVAGMESVQDRERARGRYGFILECNYQNTSFFYELFPLKGIAIRHARMAIPTKPKHAHPSALPSFLEIVSGSEISVDWNAYASLSAPVSGAVSLVISEVITELAPIEEPDNDIPTPLTSPRLNAISIAVASHHLFFYPHDAYQRLRHETGSEEVANNYPTLLRELALIVPGLSCVNSIITDEAPAIVCALEGLTFGIPALKLLRGTIQLAFRAGKLLITKVLPRFASLSTEVIMQSTQFQRAMKTAGTLMPGALNRLAGAKAFDLSAFHALASRLRSYAVPASDLTGGLRHVSGIPTITVPAQWRGTGAFDTLVEVSGIQNVPVRQLSNAVSGTLGRHYLIEFGMAYGPPLIVRQSATAALQRVNGRVGYPMSGRGAIRSPLAKPVHTRLGAQVKSSTALEEVIEANNISATPEQLSLIKTAMDDGAPLFVYTTRDGAASLALRDVYDDIYLDAFTNNRVSISGFYDHAVEKTWRVDPALQANVRQINPQLLTTNGRELIKERFDAIKSGIMDGQYLPPIHVSHMAGGFYPVINGNHRLAVAREMKLETVPVLIFQE